MKFFFGFLVGTAVGALMGLLFAPASGQEVRNQFRLRWPQMDMENQALDSAD